MHKLLVFSAVVTAISPATAIAQIASGSRDGTTNVLSDRIGMPGTTTDPLSQYETQRAMNNLPGQDARLSAAPGRARPAKPNELTSGAIVNDKTGALIAKIEQVAPDGVIVSAGSAKVKVPAEAFGHNKAGLLLDMTKAQFDQIVAKAHAAS